MKFRTQWNGQIGKPRRFDLKAQPSLTVPDQSMTIQEIMRRHARGLPVGGAKNPIYEAVENAGFDDEKMPDLSKMDFAEKEEFLDSINRELVEIKSRVNKERKERLEKQRKEDLEKGVDAAIKKLKAERLAEAKSAQGAGPEQ